MPATAYYLIHLTGILMTFLAYGALAARAALGVAAPGLRKFGAITSGVGLLLVLLGGFGLQAKLGYGFPPWLLGKIVIWVALGGLLTAINRVPTRAMLWWWVSLALGAIAVFLVYVRPGS